MAKGIDNQDEVTTQRDPVTPYNQTGDQIIFKLPLAVDFYLEAYRRKQQAEHMRLMPRSEAVRDLVTKGVQSIKEELDAFLRSEDAESLKIRK